MSLYDYQCSLTLSKEDPPFSALIMSAIRKADSENADKLEAAWPEVWREFAERYNTPGGVIEVERT